MKEKFIKALDLIQWAKQNFDKMLEDQKEIHRQIEPLLKLADLNAAFWPRNFSGRTFLELAAEMHLLDATVDLAKTRLAQCEGSAREAATFIKVEDLYQKLKQTPPAFKGMTLQHSFDMQISEIETFAQEVPILVAEVKYHVTGVISLLG